jgi:hypothetical protein
MIEVIEKRRQERLRKSCEVAGIMQDTQTGDKQLQKVADEKSTMIADFNLEELKDKRKVI